MKEIVLTQGKVALVDDFDFEEQGQFDWCAMKGRTTWYAVRAIGKRPHRTTISLHRAIMGAPKGVLVDHWDHDGLNDQRENLRVSTTAQNSRNRGKDKRNTSGFKGVSWDAAKGRWLAFIGVDGRHINLGRYSDIIEAARAHDAAAIKYHGEFAVLNFPEDRK